MPNKDVLEPSGKPGSLAGERPLRTPTVPRSPTPRSVRRQTTKSTVTRLRSASTHLGRIAAHPREPGISHRLDLLS